MTAPDGKWGIFHKRKRAFLILEPLPGGKEGGDDEVTAELPRRAMLTIHIEARTEECAAKLVRKGGAPCVIVHTSVFMPKSSISFPPLLPPPSHNYVLRNVHVKLKGWRPRVHRGTKYVSHTYLDGDGKEYSTKGEVSTYSIVLYPSFRMAVNLSGCWLGGGR